VLKLGDPTTLAAVRRGGGQGGPTSGHHRDPEQRRGQQGGPPRQSRHKTQHPGAERDSEQDAGDDPAVRGGYPTTLAPLGVNLTGMVELALGAQGTHIPHGGPVHRPHLRSTSKELRMPTACTGVVAFDGGRARGQNTQLG